MADQTARLSDAVQIEEDPDPLVSQLRHTVEASPAACFLENNGGITKHYFATAGELAHNLRYESLQHQDRKLYVLEGLPLDYVQVLGSHFDADPDIFDSHAMRKSGHLNNIPAPKPGSNKVRIFALDYPEIIVRTTPSPKVRRESSNNDFMSPCQTLEIPEGQNPAGPNLPCSVEFRHLTIVSCLTKEGAEILLLLLDNSARASVGAQWQSMSYNNLLVKAIQNLPKEKKRWSPTRKHDPMLTLAERIYENIYSSDLNLCFDQLCETFIDLVLQQWKFALEEILSHETASRFLSQQNLYLISDFIDSNMDSMQSIDGVIQKNRQEQWKRLLKRIRQYQSLNAWAQLADGFNKQERGSDGNNEDDLVVFSSDQSKYPVHERGGGDIIDIETKQSINRVTYLGGVLLPFSIIAGIFSMGGGYSPGGEHFFVFWVIAIPVCMLTTAMIYADSIRRMTVEQWLSQYGTIVPDGKLQRSTVSSIAESDSFSEYVVPSFGKRLLEFHRWRYVFRWPRSQESSDSLSESEIDDDSISTSGSSTGLSVDSNTSTQNIRKALRRSWRRLWIRRKLKHPSDPESLTGSGNAPPSPLAPGQKIPIPPAPNNPPLWIPSGTRPAPFQDQHPTSQIQPQTPSISELGQDPYSSPSKSQAPPPDQISSPVQDPTPLPQHTPSSSLPSSPVPSPKFDPGELTPPLVTPPNKALPRTVPGLKNPSLITSPSFHEKSEKNAKEHHKNEEAVHVPEAAPDPPLVAVDDFDWAPPIMKKSKRDKKKNHKAIRDVSPPISDPDKLSGAKSRSSLLPSPSHTSPSLIDPIDVPLPLSPVDSDHDEQSREDVLAGREESWKKREEHTRAELEKKKAEQEYSKKLQEEAKEAKKGSEELAKERAELEARKDAQKKESSHIPVGPQKQAPVKFRDAIGRNFQFPFHLVKTWTGMEDLIKSAFLHVEEIGSHVQEGHYDLVGPEDQVILPQIWEAVIEPGWAIRMLMWPMSAGARPPPPAPAPLPRPHGQRFGIRPHSPPSTLYRPGYRHVGITPHPPPPPPPAPPAWMSAPNNLKRSRRSDGTLDWVSQGNPKTHKNKANPSTQPTLSGPAYSRRMHRRPTNMSERYQHPVIGRDSPGEEMGWGRALGTIVGLRPTVNKSLDKDSSASSLSDR